MFRLIGGLFRESTKINSFQQWVDVVKENKKVIILTTKYVMFIAGLLSSALKEMGIESKIIRKEPVWGYSDLPHIVISPQVFRKLPKNYIAYQVEQLEASTWFNDEYKRRLEDAIAIFDYSKHNIEFLEKIYLNKRIFFLPISVNRALCNKFDLSFDKKEYDVTFYGGTDTERRKNILKILQKKYNVRVLQKIFGDKLYKELSKSKIVINIHNFDDSLLETTRIFELLSLNNCVIISEKAIDQKEYMYLEKFIEFVEIGDMDGLMAKINYYLCSNDAVKKKISSNESAVSTMTNDAYLISLQKIMDDRIL